jgi:trk system potassium uptake protein TrkA
MRVVIVGAGHDGFYLAERLTAEGQDVVVIEADEQKAGRVSDRLDAMVIVGNGASPSVLRRAGAERTDLLLAVSDADGANVMACHSAKELGTRRTVARVEDPDLREVAPSLGVDVAIDARDSAAREVLALVRNPGTSDYFEFAGGRLVLVGGRVHSDSPAARRRVADLRRASGWEWVLAASIRSGTTHVGRGDLLFEPGDHVLLMVPRDEIRRATDLLGISRPPVRRVIVLGGTQIAEMAAIAIAGEGHEVVMVEADQLRCEQMARSGKALVLHGDPTDPEVLSRLDIGKEDVVASLSGWDEINLMASLVARAVGAGTVITRFGRRSLAGLLKDVVGIDAVVSSRIAAANAILQFVRRDRILSVATFKDTDAEALELVVSPSSPTVGRTLAEIGSDPGAVVCGVIGDGSASVPRGDTRIEAESRLVVLARRDRIDDVEHAFLA